MGQLRLEEGLPLGTAGQTPLSQNLIDQLTGTLSRFRPTRISHPTHPYEIKTFSPPASRTHQFLGRYLDCENYLNLNLNLNLSLNTLAGPYL